MPHIICLRPLHPDAMARLHAEPDFKVTMLTEVNAETLREPMQTAEAIIVRATPINRDFLAKAPMLSICARHGVGYDAVDVKALTRHTADRDTGCQCAFGCRARDDADAFNIAAHAGL